jgi:cytochrome c biogenesis protein CcmG, thiol:disulfide interchange protein DsbE
VTPPPKLITNDEEFPAAEDTARPTTQRAWRIPGPKRRLAAVAVILLVALVTVAIWQATTSTSATSSDPLVGRTGQPAPAFTLPRLSNPAQDVSLAAFRGRPLVINFWASWCIPCRTEMPLLEQAFRAEQGRVQFLGIDANDTSGAARAFLNQMHVTYPAVSDSKGSVALQYNLFGLPTTVFVSSSGKIVGRHIGQLQADTLRAALKEAFGA